MIDKSEIYKWWKLFKDEKDLVEIRILGKRSFSGYYKNIDNLIRDVEKFDNDPELQIYYTLNYINEGCYGRAQNEKIAMSPKSTTNDTDIIGRKFVLIDLDPKRTTNVNSSNEELQLARRKAADIYKFLLANGFNEPIVCCSGNGFHINIPCRIGVSEETDNLIKRFLLALSMLFSDDKVEVDEKVFNRARISKLYGTTAKKGANIPERPWRMSKILKYPDEIKPVDIEYFKKIADMYPEDEIKPSSDNNYSKEKFDLVSFLDNHDIKYRVQSIAGGRKYILEHCVFNPDHKNKDAVIFQRDNGAISYVCLHNSCSHYTWKDVRLKFEPNAYDKKDYKEFQYKQRYYGQIEVPFEPVKETEEKGKKWLSFKDIKTTKISDVTAIPTGFTTLDRAIKGLLLGEVTLLSGINGSGKSSLLNIVMINAIQRGFKTACFSGELTPENMKRWMFLPTAGKQYSIKDPNHDNVYDVDDRVVERIEDWFEGKFFLFNNDYGNRYEQILSDIKEIITEKGVRLLVIDNLMAVNLGEKGDKNDRQKNFILEVVEMAKKYQVHIIIVAHPRKESGNQTLLRKESISGSSDLGNAVQNIAIVHRVGEDFVKRASEFFGKQKVEKYMEYSNVLELCKNRSMGVVDFLVGMYFEPETRRFKNYQAECLHYGWEEQPSQGYIKYMENQKVNDYLNRNNPDYESKSSDLDKFQQQYDNASSNLPFGFSVGEAPF